MSIVKREPLESRKEEIGFPFPDLNASDLRDSRSDNLVVPLLSSRLK